MVKEPLAACWNPSTEEQGKMILWNAVPGWWGLGDRVRGIASALVVAEKLRCSVMIRWEPNGACDARFDELFDCPAVFSYSRDLTSRDLFRIEPEVTMIQSMNILPDEAYRAFSSDPRTDLFDSFEEFHRLWSRQISQLKPVSEVEKMIGDFVSEHYRERMVAVHLRRTDVFDAPGQPIDADNRGEFDDRMMDAIQEIHDVHPETGFLLASDDHEYFRTWRKKLGERGIHVVAYEKEWRHALRQTSIRDALVEMYLIGHCGTILGSVSSSFLLIAQHLHGAVLRYV